MDSERTTESCRKLLSGLNLVWKVLRFTKKQESNKGNDAGDFKRKQVLSLIQTRILLLSLK